MLFVLQSRFNWIESNRHEADVKCLKLKLAIDSRFSYINNVINWWRTPSDVFSFFFLIWQNRRIWSRAQLRRCITSQKSSQLKCKHFRVNRVRQLHLTMGRIFMRKKPDLKSIILSHGRISECKWFHLCNMKNAKKVVFFFYECENFAIT